MERQIFPSSHSAKTYVLIEAQLFAYIPDVEMTSTEKVKWDLTVIANTFAYMIMFSASVTVPNLLMQKEV